MTEFERALLEAIRGLSPVPQVLARLEYVEKYQGNTVSAVHAQFNAMTTRIIELEATVHNRISKLEARIKEIE